MPMLDVVFLILIFFLLTSIVATKPVLNLDLPRAEHAEMSGRKTQHHLVIQKNGQMTLDEQSVSPAELEGRLNQMRAVSPEKKLLVSADKAAPFGVFVQVLDLAQKLNLANLEILTAPEKGP